MGSPPFYLTSRKKYGRTPCIIHYSSLKTNPALVVLLVVTLTLELGGGVNRRLFEQIGPMKLVRVHWTSIGRLSQI